MEELLAQQSGDIPSLKHGDVVEGTIVRIDKDEMLVDVGAKSEGVVSNRELYGRNAETQPELSVGDTVLVYVLQPESTDGHAVLSLRRAGLERKWRSMQEQYDAGEIIEAPVIDHNKGGLIVDCGIRGFVPISQIVDFPRRPQNDQPRDAAQEIAEKLQPYVGRKLRLKILEVNRKANRLILSEKVALYEERREKRDELFSSLQVGQQVTGTVRSIAPFGIFIDLGGIDGLVHKSELSWNKVNNPEGAYEVGDEVQAEVIDINHERGRISLSIRRMQPDPWQSTVGDLKVGDLVEGTVTKIVNFGAFVRVRDGLEGLIHISELSHQRVAHPGDVVHEGQTLKLKIISLDSERHRLGLSLKQAEEAPARPAARERRPRRSGRLRPLAGRPGARGRHRQHARGRVRPGPPADRGAGRRRSPSVVAEETVDRGRWRSPRPIAERPWPRPSRPRLVAEEAEDRGGGRRRGGRGRGGDRPRRGRRDRGRADAAEAAVEAEVDAEDRRRRRRSRPRSPPTSPRRCGEASRRGRRGRGRRGGRRRGRGAEAAAEAEVAEEVAVEAEVADARRPPRPDARRRRLAGSRGCRRHVPRDAAMTATLGQPSVLWSAARLPVVACPHGRQGPLRTGSRR